MHGNDFCGDSTLCFFMVFFILTDWLDKTSNISILSCKLQTPALLPTHVTVGLPQMEGVAYSAICDATFMSRRVIRVPFQTESRKPKKLLTYPTPRPPSQKPALHNCSPGATHLVKHHVACRRLAE